MRIENLIEELSKLPKDMLVMYYDDLSKNYVEVNSIKEVDISTFGYIWNSFYVVVLKGK